MAEHVALNLEVDAFRHLIEVRFEQRHASFRPLVLSLDHEIVHELVLGIRLRLEERSRDDLLVHDGDVFTGEQRAAAYPLVEVGNLHPRAAAERIVCAGRPHVPLKRGAHIRVLVDIRVDELVERCR